MPKAKYYAIKHGRKPGIYTTWDEAKNQVHRFSKAKYKSFNTKEEAQEYIETDDVTKIKVYRHKIDDSNVKEVTNDDDKDTVVVYTDGCCLNNGRNGAKAGIGVYFGEIDNRNIAEPLPGTRQTNQRAELMAAIRALETIPSHLNVHLYTDSKYTIKSMTEWVDKWKADGWTRALENKDLLRRLDNLVQTRQGKVKFEYVEGHAGILGNERADRLANYGATKE